MAYEIQIGDREAKADILGRQGNFYKIQVDDKVYDVDMEEVGPGIYSVLLNGKSYKIELTRGKTPKDYVIDTRNFKYDVEVIDAETKYQRSRNQDSFAGDDDTVISPVPGKVVDVVVEVGQEVQKGQTLVVVSAMKMESEFKAGKDGVIKEIKVEKNQNVEANQVLVVTE